MGVKEAPSQQAEWQEGAGSLLLLAAAQQTDLLPRVETALSPRILTTAPSLRLARLQPTTLRSQLLTLLFLEAVGLRRTWDATRATWAMLWRYSPVVLAPTGIATLSDSWRSWLKWGQMTR